MILFPTSVLSTADRTIIFCIAAGRRLEGSPEGWIAASVGEQTARIGGVSNDDVSHCG